MAGNAKVDDFALSKFSGEIKTIGVNAKESVKKWFLPSRPITRTRRLGKSF
jgi:hypothetical protein